MRKLVTKLVLTVVLSSVAVVAALAAQVDEDAGCTGCDQGTSGIFFWYGNCHIYEGSRFCTNGTCFQNMVSCQGNQTIVTEYCKCD